MRGRYLLVTLLVLGAAIAGCLGDDPGQDPTTQEQGTALHLPLALTECAQQLGVFPISFEAIAPYVPDDFTALPFFGTGPFTGSGIPGTPAMDGTIQFLVQECTPASDQGLVNEPVGVAQAWIYVDPPEAHKGSGIDAYVLAIWTAVSDPDAADRFTGWGLPAHQGLVTLGLDPSLPQPFQHGMASATDGETMIVLETPLVNAIQETIPEHVRIFGVHDRQVTGIVDFIEAQHTHQMLGTATLTLANGNAPFPLPDQPGVALHVAPGFDMEWVPLDR